MEDNVDAANDGESSLTYIYENYAAIITTRALSDLLRILQDNLLENTTAEEGTIMLISMMYLMIVVILYLYDFSWEMIITKNRFNYGKKIIYMIPTFNLLCDDNFLK